VAELKNIKDIEADFELAFKEFYQRLIGFAMVYVKDAHASEELVMDVFEKFWDCIHKTEIHSSTKAYLFKAVKNTCLNYIYKQKRYDSEKDVSILEDVNNSTHLQYEHDVQSQISEAIEALPDRCKEIFILSRIEGYKHKEIAEQLDIAPKTVEVQVRKASIILKEKLKEYAPALITWFLIS